MIKSLIIVVILSLQLMSYSNVSNSETQLQAEAKDKRSLEVDKSLINTRKTYTAPTNTSDHLNWNAKDYEKNLGKNAKNGIHNVRNLFENNQLNSKAYSSNPNEMNSDTLKNEPTVKIWGDEIQDDLIAGASSSTTGSTSVRLNSTVKCYISRDLPIRYTCPKNGLTVSRNIDSSGIDVKAQCEDNCYDQMPCVSLNANPVVNTETLPDIQLDSSTSNMTLELSKQISSDVLLERIEYNIEVIHENDPTFNNENEKYAYLSISTYDFSEEEPLFVDLQEGVQTITRKIHYLNKPVDEVYFKIKRMNPNVKIVISNIKAIYKINTKFICPDLQDISHLQPTNYGHICESGNLITFNAGLDTFKICADSGLIGDNRDGSFSDLETCQASCRKQFQCKLDVRITDTNILQDYREGCIQGQSNCSDTQNTCKNLRLSGAKILNENVFNGRQEVTETIVNSNQVQGVDRPRLLLDNAIDFQTRLAEQYKDEAYANMIANNNYKVTDFKLEDNTEFSQAYSYGIDFSNINGIPERNLQWIVKPKALDVGNGDFYFYLMLEVIAERIEKDSNLNDIKVKDKILYLKTSETNDYFKPFARMKNYANNNLIDGVYKEVVNNLASWEYLTFRDSTLLWGLHSRTAQAEHFMKKEITLDSPFARYIAIKSIRQLHENLKGIARKTFRIGPVSTNLYTGSFDGSGETIGKYTMYGFYSQSPITYEEIMNKYNNGDIKPFYDNLNSQSYSRVTKNDNGERDSNINTYLYGDITNKKAYVRIKPKGKEINKKGFLFIFAY